MMTMPTATYHQRRGQIETYFDRTASKAWEALTSDVPVSGIRATVRAGRDRMRGTLLGWLDEDLTGRRILDAGCGTGAFALEAARRGAEVLAIDISASLVQVARDRADAEGDLGSGSVEFRVGDMLDPALGRFDHVVAMDSLIHYRLRDALRVLAGLAHRTDRSVLFTFAPKTPALALMHAVGRLFPRGNRAPAIEPIGEASIRRLLMLEHDLDAFRLGRTQRIASGFYTSQALELSREAWQG
jgi:magnesium-protoporphyrin O-methyltransferase